MTKEEALALGIKVMSDINFQYDKKEKIATVFDAGKNMYQDINTWLIGFKYGEEDYGKNVGANIIIYDEEKLAKSISFRNGSIKLGYDSTKDKYFVEEKRP